MSQNITWLGNSYQNVPYIQLPKTGGGVAQFDDTAIDASVAAASSDIASGKQAVVNGVLLTGTASGGGGGSVLRGVLRPDAELVNKWTMDSYVIADLGMTIPSSYSTANFVIKASESLAAYKADPLAYRYFITERVLTTPEYSIDTIAKGRQEYTLGFAQYEWLYNPSGQMQTLDGSKSYGVYSQMQAASTTREIYWSSATAVGVYVNSLYGAYQSFQAPTVSSNKTIMIASPRIAIRGNANYLTQTFFNAITDIRCQYVIELWRVPLTGIDGWADGTQMDSIFNDINTNGGTLT